MERDRSVERMVVVASCGSRVDAQLKGGALEADGIRAVIVTDDAGGLHPQMALATGGGIRVVVPDHQADSARSLLVDLDAGVHALPSTGEHERIAGPRRGTGTALCSLGLLAAMLAYRAATLVIPGMG